MTNLISSKSDIANTLQNTNKRKSHSNFVTSKNLLENSDFRTFIDLYLNNETEFFERIDGYDGFISTQQIESIDYENFAEHVFFDSAVEKVNFAFDKSINEFPYDKSRFQVSQYLKKLDGFTKYILDNKVNKSRNYMQFDGNKSIVINDSKGSLLNDYKGKSFLDNFNPNGKSFSFDFWIYPNNISLDGEIIPSVCIFEKYGNNEGFFIKAKNHNSINDTCDISFIMSSDQNYFEFIYKNLKLEKFQHICFEVRNDLPENSFHLYVNGKEINKSSLDVNINGNINSLNLNFSSQEFKNSKVYIGNSSKLTHNLNNNYNVSFTGGFVGLIDEFRFFSGKDRDFKDILKFKDENIHSQENLKLYLRLNEPSGIYSNNHIVLDYSGNKLHGELKSVTSADNVNNIFSIIDNYERNGIVFNAEEAIDIPLKYEKDNLNPILFSVHSHDQKTILLDSAKEYDLINPNSFWKLFPKNIFLEGSDYDNISETYISDKVKSQSNVIGTERSINQELIKLISIWARFFDQIKMYIDNFTELLSFDYDKINKNKKIDGVILPLALNQMGFKFRELYAFPLKEKLDNKNLSYEEVMSTLSIRQIQNILWKRFLLNSKDYLMSKGTVRSINSVFNSFGLESNKFIKIKELNGQNRLNINNQFCSSRQKIKFIDFNRHSKKFDTTTYNNTGNALNKIYFKTERFQKTKFNSQINSFEKNWTFEFYFNFDKSKVKMFNNSQSLFRIDRTIISGQHDNPYINVVFNRKNKEVDFGDLDLYLNIENNNNTVLKETIENINLLNGYTYYICLRKKYIDSKNIYEYQLDVSPIGQLSYSYNKNIKIETSLNYEDTGSLTNIYQISCGDYKYKDTDNDLEIVGLSYETSFQGKISQIRLYDKYLHNDILRNKSKDIQFIGEKTDNMSVDNLYINIDLSENINQEYQDSNKLFNYISDLSKVENETDLKSYLYVGSDLLTDDNINSENIFSADDLILFKQNYEIDSPSNSNKIYINSFESDSIKDQYKNYNLSFSSQHHPEYLYHDDQRLYIDFSAVHFLNQDISKLISINDYFTDKLSISSYLYEQDYLDFSKLRDDYFKRIKLREEINFNMLYQVYKYFDNILEDLLYEAIPSRVNYLGFNFVYESHILERNKYQYKNSDSRIPVSNSDLYNYQNYRSQNKKFRYDDSIEFLENSLIKKV